MDLLNETEVELPLLDDEPIVVGGETAEEAALTTNIYKEIRARLAERGVPPEQVAFIHDAKTPAERQALFKAVNEGKLRILIGSTEKMGTGMNAQERLVAIHQITPPWRPGDLEQQAGRMIRQGNLYPEVYQFVHVTQHSFDAYTWQLLENKAGFIGQIANGEVAAREVDDVSENVLTYSEIKALASGNPKIMEKVLLDTELARLEAVRYAWRNAIHTARVAQHNLTVQQEQAERDIAAFTEAIQLRSANTPEKFSILLRRDLEGAEMAAVAEREQAGKRLRSLSAGIMLRSSEALEIGRYRGFSLIATIVHTPTGPAPQVFVQVGPHQMTVNIGESDTGVTLSLDAKLRSFDAELAKAQDALTVIGQKLASLETEIARPWEHEERYNHLKAKSVGLEKELHVESKATTPDAGAPTPQKDESLDTGAEVLAALERIRALHADLAVLARFDMSDEPIAITPATVEALERQVEATQAQLEFAQAILAAIPTGETVQLDLFGGFAQPAAPKRRRR